MFDRVRNTSLTHSSQSHQICYLRDIVSYLNFLLNVYQLGCLKLLESERKTQSFDRKNHDFTKSKGEFGGVLLLLLNSLHNPSKYSTLRSHIQRIF